MSQRQHKASFQGESNVLSILQQVGSQDKNDKFLQGIQYPSEDTPLMRDQYLSRRDTSSGLSA